MAWQPGNSLTFTYPEIQDRSSSVLYSNGEAQQGVQGAAGSFEIGPAPFSALRVTIPDGLRCSTVRCAGTWPLAIQSMPRRYWPTLLRRHSPSYDPDSQRIRAEPLAYRTAHSHLDPTPLVAGQGSAYSGFRISLSSVRLSRNAIKSALFL